MPKSIDPEFLDPKREEDGSNYSRRLLHRNMLGMAMAEIVSITDETFNKRVHDELDL